MALLQLLCDNTAGNTESTGLLTAETEEQAKEEGEYMSTYIAAHRYTVCTVRLGVNGGA